MEQRWMRYRKVAVLVVYGQVVLALSLVAFWRQAQLVREIWLLEDLLGDPGITLQRALDRRGYEVTGIAPGGPADGVLQVGDRVLRIGDLSDVLYPLSDY